MATCPCGLAETGSKPSGTGRHDPRASPAKEYATCCGRYLDGGEAAPTAEALMRSRYTRMRFGVKTICCKHGIPTPARLRWGWKMKPIENGWGWK
jgi:hypothetical protein